MHTCTYVLWLALSRTYTMKVEIKVSLRAAKWLINLQETFMTDFKFRYLELWIWNTIIVLLLYLSVSSVFHVQNSSINCNQQLYQKLEVKCTLASCKYTLSSKFLIYWFSSSHKVCLRDDLQTFWIERVGRSKLIQTNLSETLDVEPVMNLTH